MPRSIDQEEDTAPPSPEPPGIRGDLLDRLKWCLTSPLECIEVLDFNERDEHYWSTLLPIGESVHPVAKQFATEEPVAEMIVNFHDLQEQWQGYEEEEYEEDFQVTIKATSGTGVTVEDFVRTCHDYFQTIQEKYDPENERAQDLRPVYMYDDCSDAAPSGDPGNEFEIVITRENAGTLEDQWQRKIRMARKVREGERTSSGTIMWVVKFREAGLRRGAEALSG
jgi:hypothetical protein